MSGTSSPSPDVHDVVFTFTKEAFSDACRREFCFTADQALLAISQARDRIHRIIVADPWRSAPVKALKALLSSGQETAELDGVIPLRPLRLRRRDPTNLPALERSYRRYDSVLERSVQRFDLSHPAVLTFNPFVAAFCPLKWASTVTYYAADDWASHPRLTPWSPHYLRSYQVLRARNTRIICVSTDLAARVAADAPSVVLPNGIDENYWRQSPPIPAVVSKMRRPIVLYVGAIDKRLDLELVARTADEDAIGSIALIGPVSDSSLTKALQSISKVKLCGPMSRIEVAGALFHGDVCMIPHVINPLTCAMSPLKLYEYLAAGKPVAATDLPPVRNISERVIIDSRENFPAAVLTALSLPRQEESERLRFVSSNSWLVRHERTIRIMLADKTNWWLQ
jgi:teichuronic acid biosynthesis glycosyltransferase TuaH